MAKIILATVLVVALAGVVQMQQQNPQQGYGQNPLNGVLNTVQDLPGQLTNQLGLTPAQNQQQPQGGLLSGLLGGGNGGASSGPFEALRQLPARGLQLLNNVLTGVRDILPLGLGRNANNQNNPLGQLSPDQLLNQLPKNPVTDLAQGLLNGNNNNSGQNNMNNGLRLPSLPNLPNLPNLNQITQPITGPLQQGRLPDLNEITRGAQNTVRDLTNGLGSTLSNTLNGSQGGQPQGQGAAQGGLGGLLSSLGTATA